LGATGRDFRNFNIFFQDKFQYEVIEFTAAQIPEIASFEKTTDLSEGNNIVVVISISAPCFPRGSLSEFGF
jgi:predicted GTPase